MTLGIKIFNFLNRISPLNKKIIAILFTLCAAAVFFIFFKNFIFSIFLSICLLLVAVEVINSINEKRTELIHNQLIEFAINLIVMLKAGKSIRSIIMISADIFKPPLKNYLGLLADELKINYSFDDALDNFASNCSSREARLIATALKINNKIGGDLIFVLENIIETLQESFKIKSNARTITLQSRYSGNIVAFMPLVILFIMFSFLNNNIQDFFSSNAGNKILLIGACLEISGIMAIRKILNFKALL